jgi:hypothetical protein
LIIEIEDEPEEFSDDELELIQENFFPGGKQKKRLRMKGDRDRDVHFF